MTAAALPERALAGTAREGRGAWPWVVLVVAALAVAALTLLYPSTPTYDPWAWIVWGREIFQLDLSTTYGPSWKPLPVIFTTVFSPFGEAAPDLWLVVARAGGLLALAGGFRVATLLVERISEGRVGRWSAASVAAGGFAVLAMLVQSEFVKAITLGNSEGLLIACVLFAVDRALDGDRRSALVLAGIAGLFRPELWVFLGPYGAWLFLKEPRLRKLVVAIALALPALWFIPEYIGSGDFFRAANRAKDLQYLPYSPARAPDPTQAILDMTELMVPHTIWQLAALGLLIAVGVAAVRRNFTALVFALMPVLWVALVAFMTESGYAGNPRYLLLGTSMFCVLAAAAVGSALGLLQLAAGRVDSRLGPPAVAVAVVLVGIFGHGGELANRGHRWERLDTFLRNEEAHRATLPAAVAVAGGSDRVNACGDVVTNNFQVPMVAWYTHRHVGEVGIDAIAPGTAFQTRTTPSSVLDPPTGPPGGKVVGRIAPWIVIQACRAPVGNG